MNFLKRLFQKKKTEEAIPEIPEGEFTQEQYDEDYELKTQGLENVLGKMYEFVGHAIIPFAVGGAVDMYYFPDQIKGTGFATMELLDPEGNGPKPNRLGTYELVAFTKETLEENRNEKTPFNLIERRICGIFTTIGNYSFEVVINPNETCELPRDTDETWCLIFDEYKPDEKEFRISQRKHHLLLCIQIFRSEMDFARKNGGKELLELLKQAGYYPYSDLDREPVV